MVHSLGDNKPINNGKFDWSICLGENIVQNYSCFHVAWDSKGHLGIWQWNGFITLRLHRISLGGFVGMVCFVSGLELTFDAKKGFHLYTQGPSMTRPSNMDFLIEAL